LVESRQLYHLLLRAKLLLLKFTNFRSLYRILALLLLHFVEQHRPKLVIAHPVDPARRCIAHHESSGYTSATSSAMSPYWIGFAPAASAFL
jgi:hypothetical protein